MKDLTKSLENYLLAINEIVEQNGAARVRDVAEKTKIGAASTSEAVKTLTKKGYVNYQPYGVITLTKKGKNAVEKKLYRQEIIRQFLEDTLMVENDCGKDIEFAMPDDVLDRFVAYLTFIKKCSCKEPKWIKSFRYYVKENSMPEKCKNCTTGCRDCCG